MKKISIRGKIKKFTKNNISLQITEKDYKKLEKMFRKKGK
jgi:hypothetical protein